MATIIFSQILGLIRQRLLVSIFGASNTLGIYLASTRLPDFLFQILIAGALSSAFIPVFSDYLIKGKESEGQKIAATLLYLSLAVFAVFSLVLFIFAKQFSGLMAPGFSNAELDLLANLTRIVIFGEILFIVGSFLSAILQSYNHFFIPGFAAAMYNLGNHYRHFIVFPVSGNLFGGLRRSHWRFAFCCWRKFRCLKKWAFPLSLHFRLQSIKSSGVLDVLKLIWPRTISIAVFQLGTVITVTLVSFLQDPGRNYVIFDYAQTLAFAPVALIGQAIAQAAFPVLSKEKEKLEDFKVTFITSFNQMLYLVLPISVLLLVLRIPVVRLIFGAGLFDWPATVLTGRTLALFSISIFAQALVYLVARGFYALHDTKTPLTIGALTTALMVALGAGFIYFYHFGVLGIAFAYSIASILNFHNFIGLS